MAHLVRDARCWLFVGQQSRALGTKTDEHLPFSSTRMLVTDACLFGLSMSDANAFCMSVLTRECTPAAHRR